MKKFCLYCQEITAHYYNEEYNFFECSACFALSLSDGEPKSESSEYDPIYVAESESDSD